MNSVFNMNNHIQLYKNRTRFYMFPLLILSILNILFYNYTDFTNILYTFIIPTILCLFSLFIRGYDMKYGGGDLYHIIPLSFLFTILNFPNIFANYIPMCIQYLYIPFYTYIIYNVYPSNPKFTPDFMFRENLNWLIFVSILYFAFLILKSVENSLYYTLNFSFISLNMCLIYMIH